LTDELGLAPWEINLAGVVLSPQNDLVPMRLLLEPLIECIQRLFFKLAPSAQSFWIAGVVGRSEAAQMQQDIPMWQFAVQERFISVRVGQDDKSQRELL
jgi:hypothetical protein